jgi:hypothetical protein
VGSIRLVQSLALSPEDAERALDRLLAEHRAGPISAINLPDQCLLRMVRRHDGRGSRECILTWEPSATEGCSFVGSLAIVDRAPHETPMLVLEGEDVKLGAPDADAIGRAVLEHIGAELAAWLPGTTAARRLISQRVQRFIRTTAPMLHAASAKSARMG